MADGQIIPKYRYVKEVSALKIGAIRNNDDGDGFYGVVPKNVDQYGIIAVDDNYFNCFNVKIGGYLTIDEFNNYGYMDEEDFERNFKLVNLD